MWKFREIVKDRSFWINAWIIPGTLFGITTTLFAFFDFENNFVKHYIFIGLVIVSIIVILVRLTMLLCIRKIRLHIDGSEIMITKGDIFSYPRDYYKVIAFNEFFDTTVDDQIISKKSLNGQYLYKFHSDISDLDKRITSDQRMNQKIVERDVHRPLGGKNVRYRLGSIFKDDDFFLVAFSKFDEKNEANLKLHEYANCLINFWNEVNSLYAQKKVVVPLLGSGITRHKDFEANPHQLLEVMLWTFKISKVKFKEPSKVIIVLHDNHHKLVNFHKLKEFERIGI